MAGGRVVKNERARELASKYVDCTGAEEKPWLPQPDENVLEYYRFKFYLDQGPARSLKAVADECDLTVPAVRAISLKRDWDARAAAYDGHMVALEFRARDTQVVATASEWVDRRSQIQERAYAASLALFEKAAAMLSYPLETVTEETVEEQVDGVPTVIRRVVRMPAKWGLRDAAAMLQMADQMGRMAADMPTSNSKITVVQKKVDLAVQMVVNLMSEGRDSADIRRVLTEAQVEPDVVDAAFRLIDEGK